jgi:hypothetical protein
MAAVTKRMLYELLYMALIDLRFEGHTAQNQLVYLLADLFHNVPLQLDRVDHGDLAPDEVLHWMRQRASGTIMEAWLDQRIPEVAPRETAGG